MVFLLDSKAVVLATCTIDQCLQINLKESYVTGNTVEPVMTVHSPYCAPITTACRYAIVNNCSSDKGLTLVDIGVYTSCHIHTGICLGS